MGMPFDKGLLDTYDNLPLGFKVEAPFDLEALTANNKRGKGRWLACTGRDVPVSLVDPAFREKQIACGVFTSTVRTLAAAPVNACISADATNFYTTGPAANVGPFQVSADGITWVQGTTWNASTARCIIMAGTRLILAGSSGDFNTTPYVANANQAAATIAEKAAWTATTGGGACQNPQGLAYSPQLGLTVLAGNSAPYTLADGATAWTARTISGGTPYAVCWTGQRFIMTRTASTALAVSTDGVTWTDIYIPALFTTGQNTPSIASDGNGNVVLCLQNNSNLSGFWVSRDHGTTWESVLWPLSLGYTNSYIVKYVNGRFWYFVGDKVGVSKDGRCWQTEPIGIRGIASTVFYAMDYKNGVYCGINNGSTTALTSVEDMNKFKLPHSSRTIASAYPQYQEYVKVAL